MGNTWPHLNYLRRTIRLLLKPPIPTTPDLLLCSKMRYSAHLSYLLLLLVSGRFVLCSHCHALNSVSGIVFVNRPMSLYYLTGVVESSAGCIRSMARDTQIVSKRLLKSSECGVSKQVIFS